GYSGLGISAVRINLWQAKREPALAHFQRIGRFGGPYTYLYLGVPGFLAMTLLSYLGLAPLPLQVAPAASASVAGVGTAILFVREWRAAIEAAPRSAQEARAA